MTASGETSYQTNQFTLLENSVNYQENGVWKESEDILEPFPGGVVGRRSPTKAIFSSDLASDSAFDLQAPGGSRLRGGVRAIQLVDHQAGLVLVLGTLKQSVPGVLVEPNRVLYEDAFTGVDADVLYVWKHNLFSHNVLLRERPLLPPAFDPASTSLEIVTEFVESPKPEILDQGTEETPNHAVIRFGGLDIVVGHAFNLEKENALALGSMTTQEGASPLEKRWIESSDGRTFLLESIPWETAALSMAGLPVAAVSFGQKEVLLAERWPATPQRDRINKEIMVASRQISPGAYVIDFETLPDSGFTNYFHTGETYYIPTSFSTGSGVVFEPGSTIKYKNNAYMLLYGSISFSSTLQTPVFTSRNDDSFGDRIAGVTGETDSDGDATLHRASKTIWVYYVNFATTTWNARFRWAQTGIRYDMNTGATATQVVNKTLFEEITTAGISGYMPSATLSLSSVQKCNVPTTVSLSAGTLSGSMSTAPACQKQGFFARGYNDRTEETLVDYFHFLVPDTMGAVGPDHYMELVNEGALIYNKSGTLVESASIVTLFNKSGSRLADPRIIFDWSWGTSGRWIASVLDVPGPGQTAKVRLAVKDGDNPTGLNSWTRFEVEVSYSPSGTAYFVDFPCLGVDGNGIYVSLRLTDGGDFSPEHLCTAIIPIKKPSGGSMITSSDIKSPVYIDEDSGYKGRWTFPVLNLDSVSGSSYAYLVSKGSPGTTGGPINFKKMWWSGSTFQIDSNWSTINGSVSDYYDLDNNYTLTLPQKTNPDPTPNKLAGSRLQLPIIRNGYLWTSHHIGLDGTDGDWDGPASDRMAIQWFKLKITTSNTLSVNTSDGGLQGRIYDSDNSSTPYWFTMPSLAVNSSGDMVVGFSCARASEFIGASFWGRKADGTVSVRPALIQAGRGVFNKSRWGDYSSTLVDEETGHFWTVQQYSEVNGGLGASYGLWLNRIATQ